MLYITAAKHVYCLRQNILPTGAAYNSKAATEDVQ